MFILESAWCPLPGRVGRFSLCVSVPTYVCHLSNFHPILCSCLISAICATQFHFWKNPRFWMPVIQFPLLISNSRIWHPNTEINFSQFFDPVCFPISTVLFLLTVAMCPLRFFGPNKRYRWSSATVCDWSLKLLTKSIHELQTSFGGTSETIGARADLNPDLGFPRLRPY